MGSVSTSTAAIGQVEAKAARAGLPLPAAALLSTLLAAAAVVFGAAAAVTTPLISNGEVLPAFVGLAAAAAIAQVFVVITPKNQSYHCTLAFLLPAIFVLPPVLLLPLCLVQHLPEWVRVRYPWYIQTFNIANYSLNALAAWAAASLVTSVFAPAGSTAIAVAAVAAALTFVLTNHLLLAIMLKMARGHSLRSSGLFSMSSLSTDLAVASCGVALIGLWTANRWLPAATLATLFLIQRSLAVPVLEQETRLDPKTGLFNAAHFRSELEEELERSRRFDRPLSIVMCDLDLLRDINNRYGHVAGDIVLLGIAEILQEEVRAYDLAARFGGEEFALLLPETTVADAAEIAERVRMKLAHTRFTIPGRTRSVQATVSCGVAGYPEQDCDVVQLIEQADIALYSSKSGGRNLVSVAPSQEGLPNGSLQLAAVAR
jgi:diguanylate cyclase (GGDEF)-like protein